MTTRSKFERWWEESEHTHERMRFSPEEYSILKQIAKDAWQKAADISSRKAYKSGVECGMKINY